MTRDQARESARDILEIIPLVMRTVAAELRAAGEMPAPAHFGLLSILSTRARSLTELAALQGVSLPSMSTSITAMVDRGWVRRSSPEDDRRVVMIEVTPTGRAALDCPHCLTYYRVLVPSFRDAAIGFLHIGVPCTRDWRGERHYFYIPEGGSNL